MPDGTAEIIPSEAEIVRLVIGMLAAGEPVEKVKAELDSHHLRTRAGKAWSAGQILLLVRPIYAGMVKGRLGTYQRSSVYSAIVSLKTIRQAQKEIKKQIEDASRPTSSRLAGGRNDAPAEEGVSGLVQVLENLL
jgi:hypothetical protein